MTKKQLIKKLEKIDDNTSIILASDAEGNSFLPLDEVYVEKGIKYDPESREIIDEQEAIEEEIKEEYDKLKNCIVLFPC